jgi:two-component system, cell cycle sensor histidine kinase and response regulator CckA
MAIRNRMFGSYLLQLLVFAPAYAVVAKAGLELGAVHYVSPVYPAAGLAVGALYVGGLRLWPGVFAGSLPVAATATGAAVAVPAAAGSAAAAVAGAYVLGGVLDRARPFERVRDVAGLTAASVLAALIAATAGAGALSLGGELGHAGYLDAWRIWALGDAAGILAIAPLVIVLASFRPRPTTWDVLHAAALAAVTLALTTIVFGDWLPAYSRLYVLFPLIGWAALFKGRQAVAAVAAVVTIAGGWATVHHHGPLGHPGDLANLLVLDGFVGAYVISGLVLAAVDAQRRGAVEAARRLLHAERAARQDAEHASTRTNEILETIADAFVTLDRDWYVVYANDEALRLGGVTAEQAIGNRYWDVVPAVVGTIFERRFREAMETQQPAHFEADVPGLGLWLDVHVYPTSERLSIYFRDVTRQRRLERELALSRKMEVVGRLAGGVAHDFNNLLLAIRGYGELALRRIERHDEGAATDVAEMLKAAERGADLTRQLLAVGGRQPLNIEALDLGSCISQLEPLLRRVIGEDVDLVVTFSGEPAHVRADRSQIEQVVLNLAVNARDAMPGGGRLMIGVATAESGLGIDVPEGRVRLRVRDSGIGMTPETASQIFEPFFTTKGDKGTGLGLATVHGIVTQTGGHIELETEPGRGTTFDVYLPLSAETATRTPPARQAGQTGAKETVLIVEDDPSVRLIAARLLEDRGYIAIAARSGEEAIEIAQRPSLRIDLILSDVVMPDLNGRETVERIRSIQPHALVLFMSGYTGEETAAGVLEQEAAFIQKPFSGDQLAARVREVLDGENADG